MHSPRHYTLNDVIHAASTSSHFDYQFWFSVLSQILVHETFRYLGYLLVAIALAIITGLGYCGFVYILPFYSAPLSLTYLFNSFIGVFILFNIYYNYIYAVVTNPGTPDQDLFSIDNPDHPSSLVPTSERLKQCKKCNVLKPPRAHHCSMCERCTLRMDHHCPWVNNCIGLHNYRFFVLFLFWTTFGTLYLTTLSTPPVISIIQTEISRSARVSALPDSFSFFTFGSNNSNSSSVSGISHLWSDLEEKQKQWKEQGKVSLRGAKNPSGVRRLGEQGGAETEAVVPNQSHPLTRQLMERDSEIAPHGRVQLSQEKEEKSALSILMLFLRPHLLSDVLNELDSKTFPVIVTFMTALAVHIAVLMLFLFHAYLVSTGQTTIEFYVNMNKRPPQHPQRTTNATNPSSLSNRALPPHYAHPYDRGYLKNIQEIFGPQPWYIAILPFTRPPPPQSQEWMSETVRLGRRRADTGYGSVLDV